MNILIAPDKFKEALDAPTIAGVMASAAREALPAANVTCVPLADGGDGTGPILAAQLGGQPRTLTVRDPLGRQVSARWWWVADRALAIVEMAEASGLHLLTLQERDPLRASSYGTGQLMRAAIDMGARQIMLCVGGSATVDGGAGCLQALGWKLRDSRGSEVTVSAGGGQLSQVAAIEAPTPPPRVAITVLVDVTNPLLGPDGAAPVFGPQKGASESQVRQLAANLRHWAEVLAQSTGADVADVPGGGAVGGLPAGLMAAGGAAIERGFDVVADQLDLRQKLSESSLCLTGEGRIDAQSQHGKVVGALAELARTTRTPVVAFGGTIKVAPGQTPAELAARLLLQDLVQISDAATPLSVAIAQTEPNLRRAVRDYLLHHAC